MGKGETMVNKFADMVAAGNYSTFWVCTCCLFAHAADGCDDCDHDGFEPLSEIPATADASLGLRSEDHADDCLRRTGDRDSVPDDYECDCDRREFSQSSCDGCGKDLHGTREALFVVYDMRTAS